MNCEVFISFNIKDDVDDFGENFFSGGGRFRRENEWMGSEEMQIISVSTIATITTITANF